jgi:hypothetical protein
LYQIRRFWIEEQTSGAEQRISQIEVYYKCCANSREFEYKNINLSKKIAKMNDAALGKILLIISCLSFCYYTAWVIMLPFSDREHAINQLFPPVRYALLVPASVGLAVIGSLVVFTVYHIQCAASSH